MPYCIIGVIDHYQRINNAYHCIFDAKSKSDLLDHKLSDFSLKNAQVANIGTKGSRPETKHNHEYMNAVPLEAWIRPY